MIALELKQVEIDNCFECGGIWLDAGELEILLNENDAVESFLKSFSIAEKTMEKTRRCPICLKKMKKIYVSDEKDLIIDECGSNHGIWFDKGELSQVIRQCDGEYSQLAALLKDIFQHDHKIHKPPSENIK